MRRREFVRRSALVGALAVFVGLGAVASSAAKRTVAILSPMSGNDPGVEAFEKELARLGWIEGQTIVIERALAEGRLERLPTLAEALAASKPDVIFAPGEQGLMAAKGSTGATAIVTVACDPLDRLIVSLAAPGGSATGVSCVHSELAGKRVEMLKELVPGIARAAVLYNPKDPNKRLEFTQVEAAGRRLAIEVIAYEVTEAEAIRPTFERMVSARVQSVIVLVDAFTIFHRKTLAELAVANHLPSGFGFKEFAEAGGLFSYGASRGALFRRAASYVDKILRGANPGELPVEEPTTFELYINLRTAKALGLTIPPSLLARADEVIE